MPGESPPGASAGERSATAGVLHDPARVTAVRESGLSAAPDESMDRFAGMARRQLGVSAALVTLVEPDHQVLPGARGLAEPWATSRRTPLSHSPCSHVVATGRPLAVADVRADPELRGGLAVPGLGVVAYAGTPLTDSGGHVLGALCAIDPEPRDWTRDDLDALGDVAAACSAELRLRVAARQAEHERGRSRELSVLVELAFARSQLLLTAAQALNTTLSVEQIRHEVSELVSGELKPAHVGLLVVENGRLRQVADPRASRGGDGGFGGSGFGAALPTAVAAREHRTIWHEDRESFAAEFPPDVVRLLVALGLHALVCAPVTGSRDLLGVLVFGWDTPRRIDSAERAVITTIAAYTARALERARYVEQREGVARLMQEALLTDLPEIEGLELAACYLPAAAEETVGGDWYDAVSVPYPGQPGERALAVTVGDITGHDVHATTMMSQVRSMLRQAAWCTPGEPPSTIVEALEEALAGIPVAAHGTLLHAHLLPHGDGSGRWTLCFSNAGHPPPVLIHPDGSTGTSTGHDMLFGFPELREHRRADHLVVLEPGTTVFLHTDGLVERRGTDLDEATAGLRLLLQELAGLPTRQIVDVAVSTLVGAGHDDDVVVLAIGVPRT
ncbi:SpoIIE family protein phosphatase [Umezawaea beigongshangensis]|uniref:SpoIIE family protein phosphatase n=1 Tax=Umezawaea beigongshangensis TaxID=2780383 RepID=UPI0018F23FDA|nr:SpoIIE family protein phosphatase [Umezawaea beigongshangensis]